MLEFINTLDEYQLVFGICLVCGYFGMIAKFVSYFLGYLDEWE